MPFTPGVSTRLEGKEGMVAGAKHRSAVTPPHSNQLVCSPRAKTALRPVPPVMSPGPSSSQVGARTGMWRTKGAVGHLGNHASSLQVMGHSKVQRGAAWDSGSSLTLGSSSSPSPSLCPGHSPTASVSLDHCLEPRSTVWIP